jgi:phosphoribulokinase
MLTVSFSRNLYSMRLRKKKHDGPEASTIRPRATKLSLLEYTVVSRDGIGSGRAQKEARKQV